MGSESKTVLIVDDEEDITQLYAARVSKLGYSTRTAVNGRDAMDKFGPNVDIVLLDRQMPKMSGDEVLEEIREQGSNVPVVMVTAVDPNEDIVDMEFNDYLCKPIRQGDLDDTIEKHLKAAKYDETMDELLRLSSKIAVLEAEKTDKEIEHSDVIANLREQRDELQEQLGDEAGSKESAEAIFQSFE